MSKYITDYRRICHSYSVTLQLEEQTVSGDTYAPDALSAAVGFLEKEGDSLRSTGKLTVKEPGGSRLKFWYKTEPRCWSCPGGQHWDTDFWIGRCGEKATVAGCFAS